jgi:hypothetical protein
MGKVKPKDIPKYKPGSAFGREYEFQMNNNH